MLAKGSHLGLVGMLVSCRVVEEDKEEEGEGDAHAACQPKTEEVDEDACYRCAQRISNCSSGRRHREERKPRGQGTHISGSPGKSGA